MSTRAPLAPVTVDLDPAYVTRIVGMPIPVADMVRILEALEFTVEARHAEGARHASPLLRVTAPPHRLDIEGEHDLTEEIARIYGLDSLPTTLMDDEMAAAPGNPELDFEDAAKDLLVTAGLTEIISYRMTTASAEAKLYEPGTPSDDRPYIEVVNPINPDRTAMRHTLLSGLLESLQGNVRHHSRVALFEIGSVYLRGEGDAAVNKVEGIDEQSRLAFVLTGQSQLTTWQKRASDIPALGFFDAKGVVETLLDGLRVPAVNFAAVVHPSLQPGRAAAVRSGETQIGIFGELHPRVRAQLALDLPAEQPILIAEFDMAALRSAAEQDKLIRDVPRVPAVVEDLAIVVNDDVKAADIDRVIRTIGGKSVSDATLFDVYRGEQIGAGKKSLAYTITYQGVDKTLSEAEVEKLRAKIINQIERQLGATVRKG